MNEPEASPKGSRVFVSYSSIDRLQADALRRLFQGLGHEVFQDHVSIRSGTRWREALKRSLGEAQALVVLWTVNAKRSKEVRREYAYFHANQANRGGHLVPVRGDDTPLDEILSQYQSPNFEHGLFVNDLLEMKQEMLDEGHSPDEIESEARARLEEEGFDPDRAGVGEDSEEKRKLTFLFLGFDWWLILRRFPGEALKELGHKLLGTAWRNLGPITAATATAIVVVGAQIAIANYPPFTKFPEPSPEPAPDSTGGSFDHPIFILLRDSLDTLQPDWERLHARVESIHARLDEMAGPPWADLGPLESLVAGTAAEIRADLAGTRTVLETLRSLIEGIEIPDPVRDDRPDRILRIVERTDSTTSAIYESLAELASRPTPDLSALDSLLDMRVGLAETRRVTKRIYERIDELTNRPVLRLAEIDRLLTTQLAGPRDMLDRIHERLGGLDDSTGPTDGGLTREEVLALLRSQLAGPRDTLRRILSLLERPATHDPIVRRVLIFRGDYFVPPKPVDISVPQYPEFAKTAGSEGEVTVFAKIDSRGNVAVVDSVRPHTPLAEPLAPWAASTVGGWRFQPATGDGGNVESRVDVVFSFVLQP